MSFGADHQIHFLYVSLGSLGLGLVGLILAMWKPTWEMAIYLGLLLLFTALVGGLLLWHSRRRTLNFFQPAIFVSLLYLYAFGYAGARFILDPRLLHPSLQEDRGWIPLALFYVLLGILVFWAGYYGRLGERISRAVTNPSREKNRTTAVIRPGVVFWLYAVGLAARWYMVSQGYYAYIRQHEAYFANLAWIQILAFVEHFATYALVLAWLDYLSHPKETDRRLFAYALLASEMFWGFFSGMKIIVLAPILLICIAYTFKRRRLPLRYVLVAVVVFVLLYPLNNIYRQLINTGAVQIHGPSDMIGSTPVILSEFLFRFDDPIVYLGSGYESALSRTTITQNYALLLKYLDETGAYWHGRYMWMFPALVLVPRVVWPGKPLQDKGYWYAVNVWGQDPSVLSATAISQPGDLHLQFGLPSLLVGMFLFGIFLRFLYERYARDASDYGLFFYIPLFFTLVNHETDVIFKFAGAVKIYLMLVAISLIAFRLPPKAVNAEPATITQHSAQPAPQRSGEVHD